MGVKCEGVKRGDAIGKDETSTLTFISSVVCGSCYASRLT